MQQIQEGFGLKCSGENQAKSLCISTKCQNNAIMCGDEDCKCYATHTKCPGSTSISKLKKVFEQKSQSMLPLLDLVYNALWKQSKLVNIEMEELKKKINSHELAFSESQRTLYSLLVGKNYEGILPKLVNEALSSLEKEPEHEISQRIVEIQKGLDQKESQLKKILDSSRELLKFQDITFSSQYSTFSQTPSNTSLSPTIPTTISQTPLSPQKIIKTNKQCSPVGFQFSSTLKHYELTLLNNKTIKSNKSLATYLPVFLQPNLLDINTQTCRVHFKINKTLFGFQMFGVCQLTPNLKLAEGDIHNKMESGSLTSWDNRIFIRNTQGHKEDICNIKKYEANDIVEVKYEKSSKRVTVNNITQNTQSVSSIEVDKSLPLHFAVCLYGMNDQISIIRGKLE